MKARLATHVGTRVSLRIYWGKDCANGSYHNVQKHLFDSDEINNWELGGNVEDYTEEEWPTHCECGCEIPKEDINRQVFRKRLYDTPSGEIEPGCLYWVDWLPETTYWSNHKGDHLHAMLPNGHEWNIDSRASNCTMKEDKEHRCWCRHGEVPNIDVNKKGNTCQAGAGSIAVPGYHGFLRNGEFT